MTDEHARVEELLSAMQDGAATPDEAARVQRHLATCAQCRATASAFEQIDRQVRRYLMATPVPELASPWRNEPLVAAAPRRRGGMGHWRVTTVGLVMIFALLFAGAALTIFTRDTQREAAQVGGGPAAGAVAMALTPTQELASTSFSADPSSAAGATSRSAASSAPAPTGTQAPAAAVAGAPAPSAAAAAAVASSRPSAAASARPPAAASAAASMAPQPAAPAATPAASAAASGPPGVDTSLVNVAREFRLETATALTICRPACDEQAQAPDLLRRVVVALDQSLPLAPPVPPSTVPIPSVTLRFTLVDGRAVDLGYYLQINVLQLPQGRGVVAAPPDLVAALAGVVAPR